MNTGRLIIHRIDQESYRARQIEVYLNDEKLYEIGNDEVKNIEVPEGEHTIYAQIGWIKSPPVKLMIEGGKRKKFQLGSPAPTINQHYLPVLGILFLVAMFVSKYLQNDFIFWGALVVEGVLLAVYIYLTVGKLEHLILEEA